MKAPNSMARASTVMPGQIRAMMPKTIARTPRNASTQTCLFVAMLFTFHCVVSLCRVTVSCHCVVSLCRVTVSCHCVVSIHVHGGLVAWLGTGGGTQRR